MKAKHVVVTLVYNGAKYIERCLKSVLQQTFRPFGYVIVDDASTDKTPEIIQEYLPKLEGIGIETLHIRNQKNVDGLVNFVMVHREILKDSPETIIAQLDGDDWLYDENSLSTFFSGEYWGPDVGFVWSQHINHTGKLGCSKPLPSDVKSFQDPASSLVKFSNTWIFSHLHGWRVGVFNHVPDSKLMFRTEYFRFPVDRVMIIPMLELLGVNRIRFIPKVLYVYYANHPNSSAKRLGIDYVRRSLLYLSRLPVLDEGGKLW